MYNAAYLVVCLVVMFGMIGAVLAAVARMVSRDSIEYDRKFVWHAYERREEEEKP